MIVSKKGKMGRTFAARGKTSSICSCLDMSEGNIFLLFIRPSRRWNNYVLKRILNACSGDFVRLIQDRESFCEYDSEPDGSIKSGEFLDYLSHIKLLQNYSSPRSFVSQILPIN